MLTIFEEPGLFLGPYEELLKLLQERQRLGSTEPGLEATIEAVNRIVGHCKEIIR